MSEIKRIQMEPIVKTYYEALEQGRLLGRKCPACGHVEYPPYIACNECGNLDTEWVDLTDVRAKVGQILPPTQVFPETEYKEAYGGFMSVNILIPNADPYVTSMVYTDEYTYDELHDNLENLVVKPYIVQGEDMKVCAWVLEDFEPTAEQLNKEVDYATFVQTGSESTGENNAIEDSAVSCQYDNDPLFMQIAEVVIACAAEGYGVDEDEISLDTDIREDLSNQSMMMIAMIAGIEEELGVTIDLTEAGNMNTIRDFTIASREKM